MVWGNARQTGEVALHHAADRGDCAVVKLLLDHGADPRRTDDVRPRPLETLRGTSPVLLASLSPSPKSRSTPPSSVLHTHKTAA